LKTDLEQAALGKTPLVVETENVDSRQFLILMDATHYLSEVAGISEMAGWRAPQAIQLGNEFEFCTNETVGLEGTGGGTFRFPSCIAFGPVRVLEPFENRICVLFIPKGIEPAAFRSVMPPPGTFDIGDHFKEVLVRDYHLSRAKAAETVDLLDRCGACNVWPTGMYSGASPRVYNFTAQKDCDDVVVRSWD
jgi:hypothetical protein